MATERSPPYVKTCIYFIRKKISNIPRPFIIIVLINYSIVEK
jgi:hypothetical protein